MADPQTEPDPAAAAPAPGITRCRPLVLLIGILLALTLAGATPWIAAWRGSSQQVPAIFGGYLPALPLGIAMVLAWAWNPLMAWLRQPRAALRPWEILCLTGLFFVVAGVSGNGLAGPWRDRLMAKPALERDPMALPMVAEIPDLLAVPFAADDPAVTGLLEGLRSGGRGTFPLESLVQPALWSGALILCGILLIIGLGAMTARQWTVNERLQHPLAQIPAALVDRSILTHRGFRVALGGVLLLWVWNLSAGWGWHPLPRISTDFTLPGIDGIFGANAPGRWVTGGYWASIKLYPAAIGIAFLLTLDLGFSVWGGFWFGVLGFGLLALAGGQASFESDGRFLGAGATLGMAGLILFAGRHHYARLLLAAFGRATMDEDRPGVWGLRAALAASIAIALLVWHLGGGTFPAAAGGILAVVLVGAFALVIARVIAECGLANFQSAHEMTLLANSLGLPVLLPYGVFTTLIFLGQTLMYDTRENLSGYLVQGVAAGERGGLNPGRLHLLLGGVAIAAAGIALVSSFLAPWHLDGGKIGTGMLQSQSVTGLVAQATAAPDGPLAFWVDALFASPVLLGAGLVLAIALLRRVWVGCPINPIGLVIAVSWPVFVIWGSLMLGWLAKVLCLRYGGLGLYRRLKPAAIGLILGDVLGYCLQFLVTTLVRLGGTDLGIWRNPP